VRRGNGALQSFELRRIIELDEVGLLDPRCKQRVAPVI
jgi:hypothetical protein